MGWAFSQTGTFSQTQMVKNLPTLQEIQVQSLGQEDPLEKGMATHSSILTWRIPRTEEPGGLQSIVSQRVRHDRVTNMFTFTVKGALLQMPSHKPKFSLAWTENDYFHLNLAWHQHFLLLWFWDHCFLCQFLIIHLEAWDNSKCPTSQRNSRAWESNSVSIRQQHPV